MNKLKIISLSIFLIAKVFLAACQSKTEIFTHQESLINELLLDNSFVKGQFSFNQKEQNQKKFKMIRIIENFAWITDTSLCYFNSNGLLVIELQTSRWENGNQFFMNKDEYVYDQKKRLISKYSCSQNGGESKQYEDSISYFYNDDNLLQEIQSPTSKTYTYHYKKDKNEQVIAINKKNTNASVELSLQIGYDPSNTNYAMVTYNSGDLQFDSKYEYNNAGILISKTTSIKEHETYWSWKYNEKGDLITRFKPKGWGLAIGGEMTSFEYKYDYNQYGDWVLQTMIFDDGSTTTTQREITYW